MKNINSFLLFLYNMLLGSVHAQTVQIPVAGTQYVVAHSSTYVLFGVAANVHIVDPTGGEDQNFESNPVTGKTGVYHIRNSSTGRALGNGFARPLLRTGLYRKWCTCVQYLGRRGHIEPTLGTRLLHRTTQGG